MLAKPRIFKGFWHCGLQKTIGECNGIIRHVAVLYSFFNGFCNTIKSPELPSWIKLPRSEKFYTADLEDDFVLPTSGCNLPSWVGNFRVHDHEIDVRYVHSKSVDSRIDEISMLLNSRFTTPEAVVRALDCRKFDVSKTLVEKILKRFSNDWISALDFFRWAGMQKGYIHSADLYDAMVDILGKSKQFNIMWVFVEEMFKSGGLVSLVIMSKIMRRLAGAGMWEDAIETFQGVERFGVIKDTSAINVLMDIMCKERSVERAREVFVELRSSIAPNDHSFNILIHGWCKFRHLDEAQWTMEEMKDYGFHPCVISYVWYKFRHLDEAQWTMEEMKDHGEKFISMGFISDQN
ncbi:pentatricopeptide repeat-containing protein At3g04130, mitochondrial-like [Tasmannia lanceolata]|uniref:pentatricopeptide repeat-containing protein At3g04130, mitochondrial-like n=1 Tax=Tasmannia lanceolata TaxID=3420 RepID=UPI004063CCA1